MLSIVIVNWNTGVLLRSCVKTLFALPDWRRVGLCETLLIDNASTDGSREWLQTLKDQRIHCILSPENLGFARGCNLGIQHASGDFILLLNTDAFPEPGALEALMTYLWQHPDVGIVGPQLLYPDGHWQRSTGLIPSPHSACLDAIGVTSLRHVFAMLLWPLTGRWCRPREVEYVDGACMLIRRAMVEQIGGLNEHFFFFVEDAEYCARARHYGWKVIYLPQSRVVHLRGGSSSSKDYERTVRLRAHSEKQFVVDTQGEKAWKQFAGWRRLNFAWRSWLAKLTGQKARYERYRASYQAYQEPSL